MLARKQTKIIDLCQKIAKLAIYYSPKFAELCIVILRDTTFISVCLLNI